MVRMYWYYADTDIDYDTRVKSVAWQKGGSITWRQVNYHSSILICHNILSWLQNECTQWKPSDLEIRSDCIIVNIEDYKIFNLAIRYSLTVKNRRWGDLLYCNIPDKLFLVLFTFFERLRGLTDIESCKVEMVVFTV